MNENANRVQVTGPTGLQVTGRALEEFRPLSDVEQKLLSAAATGERAEFGAERPKEPNTENSIRAGLIRLLALKSDDQAPLHEHGIRIKGAWVDGALDLENCEVPVELTLISCVLHGDIILRDAQILALALTGSETQEISAERLRCSGHVALNGDFCAKGPVNLNRSIIDGGVSCGGGRFAGGQRGALLMDEMETKGSVELDQGFTATGLVSLSTANMGGHLKCSGGNFNGAITETKEGNSVRERALFCDQIKVGGSVFLDNGFHATGEVYLRAAEITGSLVCINGSFDNLVGTALSFEQSKIGASIYLSAGFRANGKVSLSGATVTGYLVCNGGTFDGGAKGEAIIGEQAQISGSVTMHAPFSSKGLIRLIGAQIGGNVECSGPGRIEGTEKEGLYLYGATIKGSMLIQEKFSTKGAVVLSVAKIGGNLLCSSGIFNAWTPDGLALSMEGAEIGGNVHLRDHFQATGRVRLNYAKIGGNLECQSGKFESPAGALSLDGAQVKGNVFLSNNFQAIGPVRLYGTKVGGNLECQNGSFQASAAEAFLMDAASIEGNVFLRGNFRATGCVRLYGAKIAGNLECTNGSFAAPGGGTAIDARLVQIGGEYNFQKVAKVVGKIDLAGAYAATLNDDYASWQAADAVELDGFRYDRINRADTQPARTGRSFARWLKHFLWLGETSFVLWLKKQEKFTPQPWEQLVNALRESGDARQAKIVAVHKQREIRHTKQIAGHVGRFFHAAYEWLYFYGYRPGILATWVVGVWLAFAALFWYAGEKGVIGVTDRKGFAEFIRKCPNQNETNCPELQAIGIRFDPLLFSLDQIVPAVSLQQSATWTPLTTSWLGGVVSILARVERLFGWVVAALFAGIATGLIKKD